MKNEFKKGDYIVLLTSCDGGNCWSNSIPVNHVYKLKEDYDKKHFYPELDINGSKNNGWHTTKNDNEYKSRMTARAATAEEIAAYDKENKPVHIKYAIPLENEWNKLNSEEQKLFIKKIIGELIINSCVYYKIQKIIQKDHESV